MSKTTLLQLQTLDYDTLTNITNTVTDANDSYMQEKVVGPLADLAVGVLPLGYKYLGDWDASVLGDPFYDNIETILNLSDGTYTDPGVGAKFIIKIVRQVDDESVEITTANSDILITSENREQFYVIINTTAISSMYFSNITIKVKSNITFTNCKFNNVTIIDESGDEYNLTFATCEFNNSLLKNVGNVNIGTGCRIRITDFSIAGDIIFTNYSRMYGCYANVMPIDEDTYNLTKGLNVYEPNLY